MHLLTRLICLLFIWAAASVALASPNWAQIEALAKQGKLADVKKQIPLIIKQAKQNKDDKAWREALLLNASAALGQHNQDSQAAINALSSYTWPTDPDSQLLLNLHLAHYLQGYIRANRWDIRNREVVKTAKPLPIEKQTMQQLSQRMHEAFSKAYRLAHQRGERTEQFTKLSSLKRLDSYFTNEAMYPKQVRGTIKDTVTYLWADTLKDSSFWTPEQGTQAARLLTPKLLATPYREAVNPYDTKQHPLKRAVKILSDLEQYQLSQSNTDGNLEAFRVKLDAIGSTKTSDTDAKQILYALRLRIKQQQNAKKNTPWLNRLHLELAKKLKASNEIDASIQSLNALKPCLNNNSLPKLLALCKELAANIKAPSMHMVLSKSDGLNKRSILLSHTNIDTVYFRAWKIDPNVAITKPSHSRSRVFLTQKLKQQAKPDAMWQSTLEKTTNYRSHDSYIKPPIKEEGYWLVAASNQNDFSVTKAEDKHVYSALFNLTKLSADIRYASKKLEVVTYRGDTGQLQANVSVELWPANSQRPTQRVTSNAQGIATLKAESYKDYNLLLKHGNSSAIVNNVDTYERFSAPNSTVKNALIFTDRAIYRPSQIINWKVVAYGGHTSTGKFQVSPNAKGWVRLLDANNKEVKKIPVTTNQFGSASGVFTAAADKLLGQWRIETAWGGNKYLKVEEYKRPTFKTGIEKPKQTLRLDQTAKVKGSAEYYFGGAVSDGKVTWRVTRQGIYVGNKYLSAKTVANGTVQLDKKGEFFVSFKPSSAEIKDLQDSTTLLYTINADVTDAGGETRSTSRTFSIGKATIKAAIQSDETFASVGRPFKITISRQDLDNNGRAGSGFWSLHPMQQPQTIKMPSELPAHSIDKAAERFATKGDKLRSRWTGYQGISAYTDSWRDTTKVSQGSIRHPANGDVEVTLKVPNAGLYRLRYTTKDKWGQIVKASKIIVVSNQQTAAAQLPAYLETAKSSAEIGQHVSLLAGSGFTQIPSLLEVFHGNRLVKRSVIQGGIKPQQFAVTAEHRGGLSFVLTMLKDYQLIRQEKYVSVPWTDKDLNVSFSTFRDKLRPGQKETWRISVKDSKNRPLEQGAAEVLASMFDKSLELFGSHSYPTIQGLYPTKRATFQRSGSLGVNSATTFVSPPYKTPAPYPYSNTALNLTVNILT